MLPALISVLNIAAAQDTLEVKNDEIPITLKLPRNEQGAVGWQWSLMPEPDVDISLSRYEPTPALFALGWSENFQPDLERFDLEILSADFFSELTHLDDSEGVTLGEITVRRESVEPLGTTVIIDFDSIQAFEPLEEGGEIPPPLTLNNRVMYFEVEAGFAFITGLVPAPEEEPLPLEEGEEPAPSALDEAFTDVLSTINLVKPALKDDALPYGEYTAEGGYALTLPESWRGLTAREMSIISTSRISEGPYEGYRALQVFLDPANIDGEDTFTCGIYSTGSRPVEVLAPDKSSQHAKNYRIQARVMLKGGSFKITSGGTGETVKAEIGATAPTEIAPDAIGRLEVLPLGDRDAYLWHVNGMRSGKQVQVATYYTAYDNLGLNCFVVAGEGEDHLITAFEESMRTIAVTDPESHPMVLSFMSRYRRWWPYAHPALQLYWLIVPLFLLALVPMARDWWESRG
ncbi:MAG: hypothetical protein ACI8RZ_004121 [Myxococcota bacterium]|jgi:hypothetical protein